MWPYLCNILHLSKGYTQYLISYTEQHSESLRDMATIMVKPYFSVVIVYNGLVMIKQNLIVRRKVIRKT